MKAGFTLIETLAALSGLGILSGLTVIGVDAALDRVATAEEVQDARSLITAYHSYMADHNSKLMPGFDKEAQALDLDGSLLPSEVAAYYPWRILPYLGKIDEGLLLDEKFERFLTLESPESTEFLAQRPDFGINAEFIGKSVIPTESSAPVVTHLGQVKDAHSLIVFTSSHGDVSSIVTAPESARGNWKASEFQESSRPADYGQVDFRRDGSAVTATVDGSVALLSEPELREMHRWSNK